MRDISARSVARHLTISALTRVESLVSRVSGSTDRECIQFLYFHHVFANEAASFRKLLSDLGDDYTYLPYSHAVARIAAGAIDGRFLALSFDDGFAYNVRAAGIMKELGVSGCFFLATGIIGVTDAESVAEFCRTNLKHAPVEFMGWRDVERLLRDGHEVGGHTRTHANLASITNEMVEAEIGGCFDDLQRRIGKVEHFAWPFGRFSDFSAFAAKTVFKTGFKSCASAVRGCHVACGAMTADSVCLRRDHVAATWPTNHVRYFARRNGRRATGRDNTWPSTLDPR